MIVTITTSAGSHTGTPGQILRTTRDAGPVRNVFSDSHGGLWTPCDYTHPGAKAFGPSGGAVPVVFEAIPGHAAPCEQPLAMYESWRPGCWEDDDDGWTWLQQEAVTAYESLGWRLVRETPTP